jgi:large subunit ribosomal protein L18
MAKTNDKRAARHRRKKHIRKAVHGTAEKPRLSVFRSARHIYAQLIDDENHRTLAAASSLGLEGQGGNREHAATVGRLLAEAAKEKSISRVVFDRNGYLYHGRVAALADAAREAGLQF